MSKFILCVDDSATMQQVAEITFRGTALTYVGARSADEALTKAKAQKPALVLADAVLGTGAAKSGYDVCAALKADPALADVPVIIMCGNSSPYDGAKGAQVGADGTLPKPWDTQAMLEKCIELAGKPSTVKAGGAAAPAVKPAVASAPVSAPKPAAAPAAAAANQPPRSATIMGMPTIKLPGGGTAQPVPVTPAAAAPVAPAPAASSAPTAAPMFASVPGAGRAPMVSGSTTKRSALVEATMAKMAARLAAVSGLQQGSPELAALLRLSTDVVERIVWEVVPELAEQIIREQVAARR
jgi:CheY-like chemotaxis protein